MKCFVRPSSSRPSRHIRRLLLFSWLVWSVPSGAQTTSVIGWGFNHNGQANPPGGLTNVVAVAAGGGTSAALRANGAVASWGFPLQPGMPPGLTDIAAIASGRAHVLALRSNGTVVAWGEGPSGESSVPPGLSNVVAVAGGPNHSLALRADGSVAAWGDNTLGQSTVPAGLSNVIAISAGGNSTTAFSVALQSDGTVTAWGDNHLLQTAVPPGLSNVVAIAASPFVHTVAIKSDSTVVAWGVGPLATNVPRGLTNVVAVSAGSGYSLALRANGTIAGWGENSEGEINIPATARNVAALASGWFHNLAVARSQPPMWPRILAQPRSQRVFVGRPVTFEVNATSLAPLSYQWQFRGRPILGATNTVLRVDRPQLPDSGDYAVVLRSDGLSLRSAPAFLAVSRPPVAASEGVEGWEDTELPVTLRGFDFGNLPLIAAIVALPESGSLYQFESGQRGRRIDSVPAVVTDPAFRVLYAPAVNQSGPEVDRFQFGLANEIGESLPATVIVSLRPVNDPPLAEPGVVLAREDAATEIRLNAFDVDGDRLSYLVGSPSHGTLSGTPPALLYQPAPDYFGPDSFTFSVHDGQASSGPATVSITIAAVNDPPVAVAEVFSPTLWSSNDVAHWIVLAPDNAAAEVVLDGALSLDPENQALAYGWFEPGNQEPLGTGVRSTNTLAIGRHSIVLQVSDGTELAIASLSLEVITPGEVVESILDGLADVPLPVNRRRPLLASLKAAIASLDRGDWRAGMNQLQVVENKIRAQLARTQPAAASEVIAELERLRDVLGR